MCSPFTNRSLCRALGGVTVAIMLGGVSDTALAQTIKTLRITAPVNGQVFTVSEPTEVHFRATTSGNWKTTHHLAYARLTVRLNGDAIGRSSQGVGCTYIHIPPPGFTLCNETGDFDITVDVTKTLGRGEYKVEAIASIDFTGVSRRASLSFDVVGLPDLIVTHPSFIPSTARWFTAQIDQDGAELSVFQSGKLADPAYSVGGSARADFFGPVVLGEPLHVRVSKDGFFTYVADVPVIDAPPEFLASGEVGFRVDPARWEPGSPAFSETPLIAHTEDVVVGAPGAPQTILRLRTEVFAPTPGSFPEFAYVQTLSNIGVAGGPIVTYVRLPAGTSLGVLRGFDLDEAVAAGLSSDRFAGARPLLAGFETKITRALIWYGALWTGDPIRQPGSPPHGVAGIVPLDLLTGLLDPSEQVTFFFTSPYLPVLRDFTIGYDTTAQAHAVTIQGLAPLPIAGDLDVDADVDCDDLGVVKASIGKRRVQPGFDIRADVNDDGVVDVRDLAFVARKMTAGTRCP